MRKSVVVTISVIVLAVLLISGFVSQYNGLAMQKEGINSARSEIDNLLQRRMDLIPNLVSTVKGYTEHEEGVLADISNARASMAGASAQNDTKAMLDANDTMSSALSRLLVVVENYPDLKANEQFTGLRDQLEGTENRISTARRDYNNAVEVFNKKIVRFPGNIIAGMFGFERAEYFEATKGAQETPKVDFSK